MLDGANQAWGAERWLRSYPDRVFVDPGCKTRLPFAIPPADTARFHLVVTVHGVADACRRMLGGTGSLMVNSGLSDDEARRTPFTIGDIDRTRTFVHVLDDTTMDIVLSTLDTATDFLRYLQQKESFLRSRVVLAAGEEDVLASYLMQIDGDGMHTFSLPIWIGSIRLE